MTGSVVSKQWPEPKKCDNFSLQTFDFLMTGTWKSDNCFVFTLSLSWWPEPEKKQKLFCLHTFTFMELFFNQSQGLTGIRLFPRAGIYKRVRCRPARQTTPLHQPPMEVVAAVFFLLLLVVNQGNVPQQWRKRDKHYNYILRLNIFTF